MLAPQVSYAVQDGGIRYQDEQVFRDRLEAMKNAWARRLPDLATESVIPFTGWDDWDEDGMLQPTNPLRWRL